MVYRYAGIANNEPAERAAIARYSEQTAVSISIAGPHGLRRCIRPKSGKRDARVTRHRKPYYTEQSSASIISVELALLDDERSVELVRGSAFSAHSIAHRCRFPLYASIRESRIAGIRCRDD